jgi:hypothetical protein
MKSSITVQAQVRLGDARNGEVRQAAGVNCGKAVPRWGLTMRADARSPAARSLNTVRQNRAMSESRQRPAAPGFVVLREVGAGRWRLLGEVERKPGMTARAARTQAILDATQGKAKAGEIYAAVLRSEWRVAMDWLPPNARSNDP